MSARDQDAIGMTILTTPTMDYTMKILPQDRIFSNVNHVVPRIQTVDHSSGRGITVA